MEADVAAPGWAALRADGSVVGADAEPMPRPMSRREVRAAYSAEELAELDAREHAAERDARARAVDRRVERGAPRAVAWALESAADGIRTAVGAVFSAVDEVLHPEDYP